MKPMPLNLKGAKKISSDKNSSTFALKNGHQMKIVHSALSPEHREMIEKLPLHKASGGDISDITGEGGSSKEGVPDALPPVQTQPDPSLASSVGSYIGKNVGQSIGDVEDALGKIAKPVTGAVGDFISGLVNPDGQLSTPITNKPINNQPITNQSIASQPTPSERNLASSVPNDEATSTSSETSAAPLNVNALYQQGVKGINEQKQVEQDLAQKNARTEYNDIGARQNVLDAFKRNTEDFQNQQQLFMQDYANNHIDPNHFFENQTTPQKVATAIGLFLGGWSSAYTKQGNPAMDFLNKQIDRDMQAQQSRLGQQKTLLEANQNLYHDNVMANNATRMQLNDIYAHEMQLNATKLGTPQAQAKADMAKAQWGIQNQQLLQQNAIRAAALHDIQKNGGAGVDAMTLGAAGLIPQEEAAKEQKELDSQKNAIMATNSLFKQMNKEQTAMNWLNPESSRREAALNAQLVNTVMEASPSKRLTRESIEQEIKPFEINTSDTEESRLAKQNGVLNLIGKVAAGTTPYMQRYAHNALPVYPFQQASLPQAQKGFQLGQTAFNPKTGQTLTWDGKGWR